MGGLASRREFPARSKAAKEYLLVLATLGLGTVAAIRLDAAGAGLRERVAGRFRATASARISRRGFEITMQATKEILIPYYPHPSRAPEEVGLWIFGGWREAGRQGGEALGTRCTGSQWYRSQPGPPGSPLMVPGECRRPVPRAAGLSNARWIGLAAAAAVRRCSTSGSDAATAASWPPPSAACAAAPPARSGD